MKSRWPARAAGVAAGVAAAAVCAATIQQFGREVNVSQSLSATEKAKAVRMAYVDGATFRKPWLITYADGPQGRQNIYVRASFDNGLTWAAPVLLSRDAVGAATGGQSITTAAALTFAADNDKPSIFAPPSSAGAAATVVWNSAYCPQDPAGNQAGAYVSAVQGTGDFDRDGTPDRPFHCEWVATTTDPALASWTVRQLTNGQRDAIGEVVSGNATGTALAMAWQEDPMGLQPGEAEGRGDGGSGANVSGGTNIWYTHAPSANGDSLRANIAQLSDNNTLGTGQPGASRVNLQVSGSTAVLAYEESGCPGGSGGKCIVYHSFPYASHDTNAAGTIISDVTHNSRRVRFVLQGAAAAGSSPLRAVVLWRDSPFLTPGAPADIVMRRGLVDTVARPGSTGFLPADVLADAPQRMTDVARSGGNANAHRAVVRGAFVALAYDLTPDMAGADADAQATATANYNLRFTRSLDSGAAGSWTAPLDLSGIASPATTVVEPRLAPTPGTIINPTTGAPDAGDTQNPDVVYVSYATESNDTAHRAGRIFVSRSIDQGASFEPFMPVSSALQGQSEAQLRPTPDGSSVMALWMAEQSPGDANSKDAVYAMGISTERPDLVLLANAPALQSDQEGTLNFVVRNVGRGPAGPITLSAQVPAGLQVQRVTGASACSVEGESLHCTVGEILPDRSAVVSVVLQGTVPADYAVTASVVSAEPDMQPADNTASATVKVAAAATPTEADPAQTGGGCTTAGPGAPFDPLWALLLAGAGLSMARRRRS